MPFFKGRSAPTPRNVVDIERAASDVLETREATDDTLMLLHERIVGGIFPFLVMDIFYVMDMCDTFLDFTVYLQYVFYIFLSLLGVCFWVVI